MPPAESVGRHVSLLRRWDARRLETASVTPAGSSTAVVLWSEPANVEAGPSPGLTRLLTRSLVEFGELKFRLRGPVPPTLRAIAPISTLARTWTVVGTRDAAAAERMFEEGWASGDQIGAIAASDDRARHLVSLRDLAGERLHEAEVLVGAIVDGAGMAVAAPSAARLDAVLGGLAAVLARGGVPVRDLRDGTDPRTGRDGPA